MRSQAEIPTEFFQEAWMEADHPMACVDTANAFVRVNHAFERLLGYSNSELRGQEWMSYTKQEHIGGDLASVQDVIDGKVDQYRLEKDYLHKRGHTVSIRLIVRRFPNNPVDRLSLFKVEAPIATATRNEILDSEEHVKEVIRDLRAEFEKYRTDKVSLHVGDRNNVGNDGIAGRGNTQNSDAAIQLIVKMVGAFGVVLVLCVVGLAWIVYQLRSDDPVPPPDPTRAIPTQPEVSK